MCSSCSNWFGFTSCQNTTANQNSSFIIPTKMWTMLPTTLLFGPEWTFMLYSLFYSKKKQECIPVGCVPAAHWPYAGVCFFPGGGGVCSGGGVGWVSAPGGGVCYLGGSGPGVGGGGWGCIPACTEADTPPPVDRILDTRFWKYYLGQTSLRPVISFNDTS